MKFSREPSVEQPLSRALSRGNDLLRSHIVFVAVEGLSRCTRRGKNGDGETNRRHSPWRKLNYAGGKAKRGVHGHARGSPQRDCGFHTTTAILEVTEVAESERGNERERERDWEIRQEARGYGGSGGSSELVSHHCNGEVGLSIWHADRALIISLTAALSSLVPVPLSLSLFLSLDVDHRWFHRPQWLVGRVRAYRSPVGRGWVSLPAVIAVHDYDRPASHIRRVLSEDAIPPDGISLPVNGRIWAASPAHRYPRILYSSSVP